MVPEASESSPYLSGTGIDPTKSLDLFGTPSGSFDFFASSNEPVDFFANPSSISTTSQEVDLIGIPSSSTPNGFTSYENSTIDHNNVGGDHGIEELDDDFGDFSDASAKTGPKPKVSYSCFVFVTLNTYIRVLCLIDSQFLVQELFINGIHSPVKDAVQTPDEKDQVKSQIVSHAIPLFT